MIEELVRLGSDINALDIDAPPLLLAINTNIAKNVEKLLDLGADVHIPLTISSPLHKAVEYASLDVVKMLLKAGVNVDLLDENKKTAMEVAVATKAPPEYMELLNQHATKPK